MRVEFNMQSLSKSAGTVSPHWILSNSISPIILVVCVPQSSLCYLPQFASPDSSLSNVYPTILPFVTFISFLDIWHEWDSTWILSRLEKILPNFRKATEGFFTLMILFIKITYKADFVRILHSSNKTNKYLVAIVFTSISYLQLPAIFTTRNWSLWSMGFFSRSCSFSLRC